MKINENSFFKNPSSNIEELIIFLYQFPYFSYIEFHFHLFLKNK